MDADGDTDAFARLKQAFLDAQPVQPAPIPALRVVVPPIDQDDTHTDDSPHTSDGDSGRPWRPATLQPQSQDMDSDMLNPDNLLHPRSSEWVPAPKVAAYMAARLRKPLDKEVHSCLRAECPRLALEGKVALTPEVDPKMATFLGKFIRDPKKGIDRS